MSSVESGRIGPKLVSSPDPRRDEDSENICYCPECGARVRLVGREPEDDGDRGTLPDWLPATSEVPTPLVPAIHAVLAAPAALPVSVAATVPGLAALPALPALPLLPVRPSFPALPLLAVRPSLPAPVDSGDDDDEPTRVVRVSADYGVASAISTETAAEKPAPEAAPGHRKPPGPIRHHAPGVDDVAPQLQAHPALVPPSPHLSSEVTPVMSTSSSVELPSHATMGTPFEDVRPSAQVPSAETAPLANDYYPQVGVQSTGPTARDVSFETDQPPVRQRRPKRTALLLTVGLGSGGAVAAGLALLMRGPSPLPKPFALATPVAAVAESPVNSTRTTILAALPATERAEPPAPAVSSERAEPKPVPAAAHEIALSESANAKTKLARATAPSTQKPKAAAADSDSTAEEKPAKGEPAAEEEPFDAREAASALDSAAERASSCRREADPSGVALVTITFAPSGRVTTATLAGPPFIGTATGSCIANTMRSAKVAAFSGKHTTVRKTVTIR